MSDGDMSFDIDGVNAGNLAAIIHIPERHKDIRKSTTK